MKSKQILIINSGSSSIKFALYNFDAGLKKSLHGSVQNIGVSPEVEIFDAEGSIIKKESFEKNVKYSQFYDKLISVLESKQSSNQIAAVGHRVVHGGSKYNVPIVVDKNVVEYLKSLIPFAPLHQPYNIEAIEAISKTFPDLPQIACFDTAFHITHPAVADRFGLPRELIDAGVKRYGFHGLSYEYVLIKFAEDNPEANNKKIIIAHLGNGASMCAIKNGQSIDSTMGFTALDGLVMGTRCGNLDPGVVLYLMQYKNMSAKEIESMLYKKCGLLGVSGVSNDMRTLLETNTKPVQEALDLYVYRIQHELGALTAVLGGLDTLIFTGGIGEHAWQIRERICSQFEWLGMQLNKDNNKNNQAMVHEPNSKIQIYVIPTNEEWMIAKHTYDLINKGVS